MDFKGFYDKVIFDVDKHILRKYTGKQGDTKSRGLYVTVTQRNVVIKDLTGLSMRLFYEKPDKTRGFIDGVVEGDKFRIDYTNQMFAVPGVVKAELRLMGANGEVITDKAFKILVDNSIADGSIISKDERGILDRAFELAEDIIPRLELLDVELLEDVQDEMLGARHSETKDATYDSLGQRLDASEQDLLDHKAEYTSNRQQDQLKIAKVEKELNDYKATMQQVNINQEPKQKATGYGVISLPPNAANGQISVTAKGLTATNIINNGNFANGTSGWLGTNATISVSNNIMQVVPDGSASRGWLIQNTSYSIFSSRKYFIKAKLRVTNNDCVRMFASIRSTGGSEDRTYTITAPVANQWYSLAIILDSQATHAGNFRLLFAHEYADAATANGKIMEVQEVMIIDLIAHGLESKTYEELNQMFPHWFDGTKSTVSAFRIRSVSEDESQESVVYVLAKDDEGNIEELRSLPNGVKDEISLADGKMIKRVSESIVLDHIPPDWNWVAGTPLENTYIWYGNIPDRPKGTPAIVEGLPVLHSYLEDRQGIYIGNDINIRLNKSEVGERSLAELNNWLKDNPITLIYQLAEPIIIPVQVSGNLVTYPLGTIYIEPVVADVGIYTNKMTILHQDLPIKTLEKLSKIDFTTGLETELDVSDVVIAEDKLSFTHPDLVDGDIVFFTYEYDRESTEGETEIEYYDSRYVIKDSATGKFYKWQITVADGVPSIELKEV